MSYLPTIAAVVTALVTAVAEPVQAFVASHPLAAFFVTLAGVVASHFTPSPLAPKQ